MGVIITNTEHHVPGSVSSALLILLTRVNFTTPCEIGTVFIPTLQDGKPDAQKRGGNFSMITQLESGRARIHLRHSDSEVCLLISILCRKVEKILRGLDFSPPRDTLKS